MREAFFEPLGAGRFRAQATTGGPWSPTLQHGGPPTALLIEAMQALPGPSGRLTRVTAEFLSPVPVGEVEVSAQLLRDGANVRLLGAELRAHDRVVMRASAWRMRLRDDAPRYVGAPVPAMPAAPAVGVAADADAPSGGEPDGFTFPYARAVQWRMVAGSPTTPGPASTWARARIPLVAGQPTAALPHLALLADSGSGISAALDWSRWSFVNVEITLHLARQPEPGWVGLDAATTLAGDGTGLALTRLFDEAGWVGTASQSLLVAARRRA